MHGSFGKRMFVSYFVKIYTGITKPRNAETKHRNSPFFFLSFFFFYETPKQYFLFCMVILLINNFRSMETKLKKLAREPEDNWNLLQVSRNQLAHFN